jgi:chitinase
MKLILSTTLACLFSALPSSVDAHAFMTEPASRNQVATTNGTWQSGTAGVPPTETTPQGLNSNTNVCGKQGGTDYDLWLDAAGSPMQWRSQTTYSKGEEIQVDVHVTAHHYGHFTLKACPLGRESTQECFDANPLTFVEDTKYGMPKDLNNPGRAMLWGDGVNLSYLFKLPDNIAGDEVLLQWVYWTANNCNYDGYDQYFTTNQTPPSTKGNYNPALSGCGPIEEIPMIRVGTVIAEIFVNCAEVTVAGEPTPTPPISPPTPTPPAPIPAPVLLPPTDDSITGTCGGGNRGNGICGPNQSMCCSQWGFCGFAATGHCDGTPAPPIESPVQSPIVVNPSPTTPIENQNEDSRLIAYVGNWQSCPTDEQMAQYTHIVIAFAVSYSWSPGKNICSETCEIDTPPVCENSARPDLIQKWKDAGKKIILSFGGAGMGGSWAGDNNDCWDYCFGRETQVVNRLTTIVNEMGLDGVDIDYEYFYEDNQNGSGFTKGAQAQTFLRDVTVGLRNSMPAGSELTHAPMEPDMEPGTAYFNVLKEVASSLDFLMPQYYNGYVHSLSNFPGALSHFTTIANEMFNGDASKIVYGFCINDCGSFNLDGYQSAEVMEQLSETYPCNGGAFFWVANDDLNGEWSKPMQSQLALDSTSCSDRAPTNLITSSPVATPITNAPVVASSPTNAPVLATAPPTDAPVPNPTNAPVVNPTNAPVSPVPNPTNAPISAPTGGGGGNANACCSYDFRTCATWGNESRETCEALGSMIWLENGPLVGNTCLANDAGCTNNISGCCGGLVCQGTEWYKQCKKEIQI